MMPPTVPTWPLGAISDGIDHPTGAAAARPPRAMEIPRDRPTGVRGEGGAEHGQAEEHAGDEHGPAHARLLVPARDQVVNQPPADEEVVKVARAQGIAVYPADCRMLMWSVRTR